MSEKFQKYNFAGDENYQKYLQSLYPTPSYAKLEVLKRKWYKKNIDIEFDIEFDKNNNQQQQQQQQQQQGQQQQQQQQGQQQQQQEKKQNLNVLYHLEGVAKIFFFATLLFRFFFFAKILIVLVSLLQIIRNKGMIKFNVQYAQQIFPTEFLGNIIYSVTLFLPPGRNSYLWFLPIALNMLTGSAEYIVSVNHVIYKKIPQVKTFLDYVRANRGYIIHMKQRVEIYLLFYTIIGVFFGLSSLIHIIVMVQYIGLKNKVNRNMQTVHWEMIQKANVFIGSLPGPAKLILGKVLQGYQKVLSFI